jgi:RNA polymerase sigma factor (sigma-70 family)
MTVRNLRQLVQDLVRKQGFRAGEPVDFQRLHEVLPPDLSLEEIEQVIDFLFALQDHDSEVDESPSSESIDGTNALAVYVHRMRQIPRLSKDEEDELIESRALGNPRAEEALIESYLPMVLNMARETGRRREEILDYVQEGSLALMKAVQSFQPDGSKNLRDYVRWYIRRAVHKASKVFKASLHFPRKLTSFFSGFRETADHLARRLNRTPYLEEIACEMSLDLDLVQSNLTLGAPMLDPAKEADDADQILLHYIKDAITLKDLELDEAGELGALIQDNLDILPPLEQEIIRLHYGMKPGMARMDLFEIAKDLDLKTQHVIDLESAALDLIRQHIARGGGEE